MYSNDKHTELEAADALASRPALTHVIASGTHRYLHTKLFYFEKGERYTAVIGSANLTEGGLVQNEELSIIVSGVKADSRHKQFEDYLLALPAALRRVNPPSLGYPKRMPKPKKETAKQLKIARKQVLRLADTLSEIDPEYRLFAYKKALRDEAQTSAQRGSPLLPGAFEGSKRK